MADDNIVNIKPKRLRKDGLPFTPGPGRGHKIKMNDRPPTGAGIGGPAKGASRSSGKIGEHTENWGRMEPVRRVQKIADKEAAAEEFLANIYDLAFNAESEATRLNASVAGINQINGMPLTRIAGTPGGETQQELRTIDAAELTSEQRRMLRQVIGKASGN